MLKAKKQEILKHSSAHILAAAVLEMFPEAKFGIGPATEDGFYYDFQLPRRLTPEDLPILEEKMKNIIKAKHSFKRIEMSLEEAKNKFKKAKQIYKEELLDDIEKEENPDKVSLYETGKFIDLCRGPHLDSTGDIRYDSFKLTKISSAYWKGDENNEQLQRIYGVVFPNKKELKKYLNTLEEAKKRDHRQLGKDLGLFIFSKTVGKGLPLWTKKGSIIRRELEKFIIDEEIKRGYQHVYTPDIAKVDLYKKSGHYPYYKESMYAPIKIDNEEFMLRPMSCPHHFEMFLNVPRSYRELPMRIAEMAKLYRYEQSGELTGLMRTRTFCLADAHILCANEKQAREEINQALDLIEYVTKTLGLKLNENYWYRLSLGDVKDNKKYHKNDKKWNQSENLLRQVLEDRKAKLKEALGEAAFYGPKIDIQMKNVYGKEDTAFTVQYDFVMPERFNLEYTDKDGKKKKIIVIHRSSVGAIERIIAFLIEHYAGAFPIWLSPVQVMIIPVSQKFNQYGEKVLEELKNNNLRAELNTEDETLGKRITLAEKQKTPYILVVGEKEQKSDSVAIRSRKNKKPEVTKTEEFIDKVKKEVEEKL